jgi:hypothetical protein
MTANLYVAPNVTYDAHYEASLKVISCFELSSDLGRITELAGFAQLQSDKDNLAVLLIVLRILI